MPDRLPREPLGRYLGTLLFLALAYGLAGSVSRLLVIPGADPAGLWLCSGVAIAALSLGGLRLWPAVFIGAIGLGLAHLGSAPAAIENWSSLLTAALGRTIAPVFAASVLRRAAPHPLDTLWGVFRFLGAAVVAAAGSTAGGMAGLLAGPALPVGDLAGVAETWWLGDLAGSLLVVPLAFAWADPRPAAQAHASRDSGLLLASAFAAICLLIFLAPGPTTMVRLAVFLVFPAIAVGAYVFGSRGVTVAVLTVAACALAGTMRGCGPFASGSVIDRGAGLDSCLIFCAAIGMALSADRIERAQAGIDRSTARDITPWLALLAALALTVGAWTAVAEETEREGADRFARMCEQLRWRLQARMQEYERLLHGDAALFAAAPRVDRAAWHAFVAGQDIARRLPGIQGIGYIARVAAGDRERFLATVRRDGFPDFAMFPPGARTEYMPVVYIEPFDARNRRAFGYDVYSEPVRRQAISAARDSGRAVLTDRVRLVQEDDDRPQAGFLLYIPVYRNGAAVQTVAQRRAALTGFVYSPFRMGDLIDAVLRDGWPQLHLQVFDGTSPSGDSLIFSDPAFVPAANPAGVARRQDVSAELLGHPVTLRVASTPDFEATVDHRRAQLAFLAGILVSLLMFGTVRAQTSMGERAAVLARRMTQELAASEARYRMLYEASPAMLHSIDRHGRLVAVSDAWLARLGYTREQVLDRSSTDFLTEASRLRARDQVLPAFFRDGQCDAVEYEMVCSDGSVIDVLLSAVLLPGEHSDSLAFLEDITDRKQAEREAGAARARAREINERLAAIVASSGEAIISQSLDGSIETWNRGAESLFGFMAEEIVGRSARTLLPPDKLLEEQRLVERVIGGESIVQHQTMRLHRDGTPLDVAVTLSPITGAEGRLVGISKVVRDITPQRLLREIQERQAAILQGAGVSIIATDARGIIQSFNAEAERMLGFAAHEVTGTSLTAMIHVPREVQERALQLSAQLGVYVPANYEALFAWARRGAVDQREWTYMRRDGSRLPVSLSVSATRASDGQINGFICIAIDISARKAHEALQRTALHEKETLLKEVYHRVKNNLQVVTSLFNLQLRGMPDGAARTTLQQSADRVRAMALVHEKLCRSNNLETIDIVSYVRELCESLAAATAASERGIAMVLDIEPIEIGLDASVPLGLLLNELICNSLKHAFPEGRSGTVTVRLAREGTGNAVLAVCDDGVGMPAGRFDGRPTSLGLRLAATLARQLGGKLRQESNPGVGVTLVFPLGDGMRTARLQSIGMHDAVKPPAGEALAV